jgi:ABC-type lipoprotein export system ATPase subunit
LSEPFILCDGLVKIYKIAGLEQVALRELNLSVQPGELMAIVGASGSGKTTLMNILGGLDRPSAGRVRSAARTCCGCPTATSTAIVASK